MLHTAVVAVRDRARLQEIVGTLLRFGVRPTRRHSLACRAVDLAQHRGRGGGSPTPPSAVRSACAWPIQRWARASSSWARSWPHAPTCCRDRPHPGNPAHPGHAPALVGDAAHIEAQRPPRARCRFHPEPIAAASIAQVYRAQLRRPDGSLREVAVKVQRPDIRAGLEADARLLRHVAALVEERFPQLERYRPSVMWRARSATPCAKSWTSASRAAATNWWPRPLPVIRTSPSRASSRRLSTPELLVQDWLDGLPANRAAVNARFDGRLLAQRGAHAFLHMVLRDGLFHADPHPGNLFALPGNRVGFIDFGLVGHLATRANRCCCAPWSKVMPTAWSWCCWNGPATAGSASA